MQSPYLAVFLTSVSISSSTQGCWLSVYLYLPKMESHLEARLWNDVFNVAQDFTAGFSIFGEAGEG
jgi:malate synthase